MRKKLMAGPYLLWMLVFTIVPLLFVFYYGFTSSDGAFTFSNITAIFEKIHIQALGLSLLLAVITTAVCLLLAYPLALILSKSAAKNRSFVIFIFILPMWINFLLRIIAIRMLLSDNGILNSVLSALNLPNFSIMYTPAIVIGMVYDYFPFMVLPIYNALIKIDRNLLEAAGDLGAHRVRIARHIVLAPWPGCKIAVGALARAERHMDIQTQRRHGKSSSFLKNSGGRERKGTLLSSVKKVTKNLCCGRKSCWF